MVYPTHEELESLAAYATARGDTILAWTCRVAMRKVESAGAQDVEVAQRECARVIRQRAATAIRESQQTLAFGSLV